MSMAPLVVLPSFAITAGCISVLLLKTKPTVFSGSLADFRGVTAVKSSLFILTLVAFFAGISLEAGAVEQLRWSTLFYILTLAAWIDIELRIIPNPLILFGIAVWLLLAALTGGQFKGALLALLIGAVFVLLNLVSGRLFGKQGMGVGDVKLCLVIALLGGAEGLWFIGVSVFAGGICAGFALTCRTIDRKSYLPFAPFLLCGSAAGYFLISWQEFTNLLYGF